MKEAVQPIPMLDLKLEYEYLKEDIDRAISGCLEHQKWILGPEVKELENAVASYIGVKHCVGVSSGTEALVLSLRALSLKLKGNEYFEKEDKIITTPFTFTATGDAILRAGATPVFVDIDPSTYNLDISKVKEYLSSGGKAVGMVPVHLYGKACEMDLVMELARNYGLFIVEDVAQAFGAMYKSRKLGSIGDTGCFSFFPSKNLGGFGDGGMVSVNDDELASLIRMLLKHGGRDKYNVDHIGYNARLDTLQAAVLLAKIKYIDEFNLMRRKIALIYDSLLEGAEEITLPIASLNDYHAYHQYTIRVKNGKREELQKFLYGKGISTMVYYPVPLHKMKVFGGRCEIPFPLKESERAVQEVLSLPIEPLMTPEQTEFIIKSIKEFYSG